MMLEPVQLENSTVKLMAHAASECVGETCPLHKRTHHHMRSWPQHWRDDQRLIERTCPHGVGHPDPDTPDSRGAGLGDVSFIHGCDGCCRLPVDFDMDEFRERALSLLDQEI